MNSKDEPIIITHRPELNEPRPEPVGSAPQPVSPPRPLGELVERFAKPIARAVDALTAAAASAGVPIKPTHINGCSACSKRRRWLNAKVPDARPAALLRRLLKALRRAP
jgi:hypothetical protein